MTKTSEAQQITTVKAESAPLGVQLWPTTAPQYAPNFTLAKVTRELNGNGDEFVTWIYQNGNVRVFSLGEEVAVQIVGS